MEAADQNRDSEAQSIPLGFAIEQSATDALVIHHQRTGMGCMNVFLVGWLIAWSMFLVFYLVQYLTEGGAVEGDGWTSFWYFLFMCIAEVFVACVVAYSLFARQSFCIEAAHLTMETDVLGFKRRATIAGFHREDRPREGRRGRRRQLPKLGPKARGREGG